MSKTILVHGFNIRDGGRATVGRLARYFDDAEMFSYGWTGLLGLRWNNDDAVAELLDRIEPGDTLVAHSNAGLIAWRLAQLGAPLGAVICIHPALRRDAQWPDGLPVLCLHSKEDWVVSLGRIWGRFASVANPFRDRHGWGAAGRHGFDSPGVENWETNGGHSEVFERYRLWGPLVSAWKAAAVSKVSAIKNPG